MPELKKPILVVVSVLVLANIIALWIVNIVQSRQMGELEASKTRLTSQLSQLMEPVQPDTSSVSGQVAAQPDLAALQADVAELKAEKTKTSSLVASIQGSLQDAWTRITKVEEAATTTQTTSAPPAPAPATSVGGSSVKEQLFYLGSGTATSTSWVDVPAAQTTLDSRNFDLHEVKFEAGLSTIGGEVYARLVNKHDGVTLSNSTLTHNTQTATWKSATISLGNESQTYQVQIRSSSGEKVTLHGAQIRIYTN